MRLGIAHRPVNHRTIFMTYRGG